ncbi:MAG: glucosaminidase domain-containing protein [Peptoniphilus sp. oral taxon 375]|nr:glucosaminidase domain-containing protein [Peptoniphilus sp. oral taxon 375]
MIKILLDPGHGGGPGFNRGFKQVDNLPYCNEGDCNFIYSRDHLKPALEAYGFAVGMTKWKIGRDPSLKARGSMGRGYDLLISCHSNACNGGVRGVEIWDSTNPKESIKSLTDRLCNTIATTLGIPNRGTKYRRNSSGSNYYGILRYGQAKHNFIIEHAFHDNLSDATVYRKTLDKLAKAVAKTLASYYGLYKDPAPTKPVSEVVLTEDKFIQTLADSMRGKDLSILPSVTMAQAILESNWGKSELAQYGKNLFGIKASNDWDGTIYKKKTREQKKTGEIYTVVADFRKYNSWAESILDHDKFFTSTPWRQKNYARVLEAKNYKAQAQALQACGYATDLNYGKKLIQLIERLGLQQYDKGVEKYVTRDITKPADWAKDDWQWGIDEKLTDGSNPGGPCTREQVISILRRYDEKQKIGK